MICLIGIILLPSSFSLLQQFSSFFLMILLIPSLSFCLVPSQASSEDQSECTRDESGTGEGWWIAHGNLCAGGLGTYSVWSAWQIRGSRQASCGGGGSHCWTCRHCSWGWIMSHVQFSIFSDFLQSPASLFARLVLPYWSEGIRVSLFMDFLLFLFVISYFLPEGRKGFHLPTTGAIWSHLGCSVPPVGIDAIHHPDGYLYVNCVFRDGTVKVVKVKVTMCLAVEIDSWKVSILSYTVYWVLEDNVNQVNPCFSMMWKSNGSLFIIHLILYLSLNFIGTNLGRFILLLL